MAVDDLHVGLCAADISGHVAPRPERIADHRDTWCVAECCRRRVEMRLRQPSQARFILFHGRIQTGAQGASAPFKPMAGRGGRIRSVLLALPVKFQNALKH